MKRFFLFSVALVVLLSGFTSPAPVNNTIAIIVNASNPIEKMTPTVVRIYWLRTGKKRWPGINKNIKPVNRKTKCKEKETFLSKILEMKDDDVESYFTAKQYQYAEVPPEKFLTDAEIIDYVSNEEGAIAFVNAGSVEVAKNSRVKIVYQFVE